MDILGHFELALDNMKAPSKLKAQPCIECAIYHGATEPVKGCEDCEVAPKAETWQKLKVTKTK